MGVQARLVLFAPDSATAQTAARAAFARMAALEDVMSDYRPTSELMRLAARAGEGPVLVSDDLFRVLDRAQRYAAASAGAFDVTAGPVVRLWREARRQGYLPDAAARDSARALAGYRHLRLDEGARTATLVRPGLQLDLGAIGKGYAADAALATLAAHGIDRALVELGGEVAVGAPPPGADGWRIRLANAAAGQDALTLARAAVSTSGGTEQFIEADGVRYSHVVDPRTGLGLTHRLAVTVVAPDAFTSDPLATLVSVLGPVEGPRVAQRLAPEATVYVRSVEAAADAAGRP